MFMDDVGAASAPASAPPENMNIPYLFQSPNLNNDPSLLMNHISMQNPQMGVSEFDWASVLSGSNNIVNQHDHQVEPASSPGVSLNASRNGDVMNRHHKVMGRVGKGRKYVPPRVAFHTRSSEDILDDGYKWRKYGQKAVKNSSHPRSYYRCTHHTCSVKKQIQRLSKDTGIVVTTYEGIHNHPCEKLMETLSPLLRQLQFLTRF